MSKSLLINSPVCSDRSHKCHSYLMHYIHTFIFSYIKSLIPELTLCITMIFLYSKWSWNEQWTAWKLETFFLFSSFHIIFESTRRKNKHTCISITIFHYTFLQTQISTITVQLGNFYNACFLCNTVLIVNQFIFLPASSNSICRNHLLTKAS